MRCDSDCSSTESKRQSSTFVAFSENSAKFTPMPSQVAPSGSGWPGQTRIGIDPAPPPSAIQPTLSLATIQDLFRDRPYMVRSKAFQHFWVFFPAQAGQHCTNLGSQTMHIHIKG